LFGVAADCAPYNLDLLYFYFVADLALACYVLTRMCCFVQILVAYTLATAYGIVACLSTKTVGRIIGCNALTEIVGSDWLLLGLKSVENGRLSESAWLSRTGNFLCFLLIDLFGCFQMLLNSFFFGQGTTLPVTFVFVG
jgi:hypothetical protein